jgi:hypothetical protein
MIKQIIPNNICKFIFFFKNQIMQYKKIKPIIIPNKLINDIFPSEINSIIHEYIGPQINVDRLIQLNSILYKRQNEILQCYTNDLFKKLLKHHVHLYKGYGDKIYGVFYNQNKDSNLLTISNIEYDNSGNSAISIINQSKIFPSIRVLYDIDEITFLLYVRIIF